MPKLNTKSNKEKETDYSNGAIKKFRSMGFAEKDSPDFEEPKMPQNITSIKVTELGNLMSKYAAWREYAEEQVALATAEYTLKKHEFDYEYAKKYLLLPERSKETEKSKERKLVTDESLKKLSDDLLQAEMFMELLSAKQESYNNSVFVISREFTRRGQTVEPR